MALPALLGGGAQGCFGVGAWGLGLGVGWFRVGSCAWRFWVGFFACNNRSRSFHDYANLPSRHVAQFIKQSQRRQSRFY